MKRTPLRKKSRTSIAKLKDKLWNLFSLYIRNRDGWTCITCGTVSEQGTGKMQAGHYVPKGLSENLRFDERNVWAQCVHCNMWRHGNLSIYAIKIRERLGPGILEELDRDRKIVRQWTEEELQNLINHYQNENEKTN